MKIEDEIKSNFRNDKHKAFVNMLYTHNILSAQFFSMLKNYGLAPPQFNVLRILRGQMPHASSIGLIKERMLDKNSDVSRIIDRLYKKELVKRTECDTDRRQKDIYISKKGLDLLDKMSNCEKEQDKLLANLDKNEIRLFNGLLDKLRG